MLVSEPDRIQDHNTYAEEVEYMPGFVDYAGNPVQLNNNQINQLIAASAGNDPTEEIIEQLDSD